jgi:DNA-binding response OmpR family regulator
MSGHILVVEDDSWQASQYKRVLGNAEFTVSIAPNAITAIDLIDIKKPDVILLDLLLEGTTAMALLNELQSHHDLSKIPIVMITANAEQISISSLKPYGVVEILDKVSMLPSDVRIAVRKLLHE